MSDEFPFEAGDTVLIRVRENKTSGPLRAKLVAECTGFEGEDRMTGTRARFDFPVRTMNSITLATYEAEFEPVEDASEVTF